MSPRRAMPAAALLVVALTAASSLMGADLACERAFAEGVRAYQSSDWPRAARNLEICRHADVEPPRRQQATFYLAEVCVQLGEPARARELYESFLAAVGDDPQITVIRARFRLGEMSYLLRDYARSQGELRQFVARHPDDELARHASKYLDQIEAQGSPSTQAPNPAHTHAPPHPPDDSGPPDMPGAGMPAAGTQPPLKEIELHRRDDSRPPGIAAEIANRRRTEAAWRRQGRQREADQEAARIRVLSAYQRDTQHLDPIQEPTDRLDTAEAEGQGGRVPEPSDWPSAESNG